LPAANVGAASAAKLAIYIKGNARNLNIYELRG